MKEEYEFRAFTVSIIEDRILRVDIKKIKEMIVQDVIDLYACIGKIGKGKKVATLTTFQGYVPMNKDVMEYSAKKECQEKILASAIVINSAALRLSLKFFMGFYRQETPRKVFNDKHHAIGWLREMRSKEK